MKRLGRWAFNILAGLSLVVSIASAASGAGATKPALPAATKPVYLEGHDAPVVSVAFTADGQSVVSGSWDRTIRLWNLKSGKERRRFVGHRNNVVSVAVSPNGRTLASGGQDRTVRLWDIESGEQLAIVDDFRSGGPTVTFSRDGTLLAASDFQCVRLLDAKALKEGKRLRAVSTVTEVSFSGDGKLLAGVVDEEKRNEGGVVKIWDVGSGQTVREYPAPRMAFGFVNIWSVDLSPDGSTLLEGGQKGVAVREVSSDKSLFEFGGPGGAINISSAQFSADGSLAAAAGGINALWVWETKNWRVVGRFFDSAGPLHEMLTPDYFAGVAFSPDGKRVAVGCTDGRVRVWEVPGER